MERRYLRCWLNEVAVVIGRGVICAKWGGAVGDGTALTCTMKVRKRLKAPALPLLLSAVAVFVGNPVATRAAVVQPGAALATGTVPVGDAKARLTPVRQVSASSVLPINIFSGQLNFTNGAFNLSANVFTVPAGKRLVIEFVSAVAILGTRPIPPDC